MNEDQLQQVIRSAARVTGLTEFVIIGSQAILGSFASDELPPVATMSNEADVAIDDAVLVGVDATAMADLIDGALGEGSGYHETHGHYAQGVEVTTAVLPIGWRERLTRFDAPLAEGGIAVGWCLEAHDLWVSKSAAAREKDVEFCSALARAGLVDRGTIEERVALIDEPYRTRAQGVVRAAFG